MRLVQCALVLEKRKQFACAPQLDRMVTGRTSVVIAHRLSIVHRADTILVMHKARDASMDRTTNFWNIEVFTGSYTGYSRRIKRRRLRADCKHATRAGHGLDRYIVDFK